MESQELHLLLKINPGQSKVGQIKPHKYALILAIIKLYERQPSRLNRFHITEELEATFEFAFRTLSPDFAFSSAMLEAPFFYGSSSFDVEFMKPPRPESGPQSGRPW